MRRKKTKWMFITFSIMLAASVLFGKGITSEFLSAKNVEAKDIKKGKAQSNKLECSIGTAEQYIANQLKLTTNGSGYGAYRDALVLEEILLPTELTDTKQSITKAELALLASRIMRYKEEKEDTELSKIIVSQKRISDLSKVEEPYQSAIVRVFGAGVMVGSSNGTYSQSRKFKSNETMSHGAMKSAILKALGKKKRSIMSPDGQLTRTTKLPKNYKKYNYILASFPNKFYEMKFMNQRVAGSNQPKYYSGYCYPRDMKNCTYNSGYKILQVSDMLKQYRSEWEEKIKENLSYRLNFDYKTVDCDWVKGLAKTYYIPLGEDVDESRIDWINQYVKTAKKNHVKISCSEISVDAGTCYMFLGDFYMRCHAKIRVNADTIYSAASMRQTELIYSSGDLIKLIHLKKGRTYDIVFETAIGAKACGDTGYGFAVSDDWIVDWYKLKGR